jgi:predicted nucleic acid-binding protein
VILLDTNYLIRFLVKGTKETEFIQHWMQEKVQLTTSSICWYEFLCGPVDEEGILLVSSVLDDHILPFSPAQAREASRLFNSCGRNRRVRVDAMIAAAAIVSESALATGNTDDFAPFAELGLKLV